MPAKKFQALRRVFEDPFSALRIFCSFFDKMVFIGMTLSTCAVFSPSSVVFSELFLLVNATSPIWRQFLVLMSGFTLIDGQQFTLNEGYCSASAIRQGR